MTKFGFDDEMGLLDLNEIHYDEEKVYARMRDISNKLYADTIELLRNNYSYVEKLVGALSEKETLSGSEVDELFKSGEAQYSMGEGDNIVYVKGSKANEGEADAGDNVVTD